MISDEPADASGSRVLIVDDEAGVREVVGRLLESEGAVVVKAEDGTEGLRLFEAQKFTLVITDRVLPGLSGEELTKAIKAQSPPTPVLLITGQFYGAMEAMPYDGLMRKPFTRTQLISAIDKLLPSWRTTTG